MGQKTHPKGFRVGIIESWDSRWFAKRDFAVLLHEDLRVRRFLKARLHHAGIAKIEIERAAAKARVDIHTARPGLVIGKKGAEIEKLKAELHKLMAARPTSTSSRCGAPTSMASWWPRTWRCSWSVVWPSVGR